MALSKAASVRMSRVSGLPNHPDYAPATICCHAAWLHRQPELTKRLECQAQRLSNAVMVEAVPWSYSVQGCGRCHLPFVTLAIADVSGAFFRPEFQTSLAAAKHLSIPVARSIGPAGK